MRSRRLTVLQMRPLRQIIVSVVVVLVLLYSAGCSKKPSQLPAQAKAPVDTIPSSLPPEISEETPPPPPAPAPKQEAPPAEPEKPKPVQHHKKKSTSPPASTTAQNSTSPAATAPASSGNTTIAAAHPPANPAGEAPATAIGADVTSAQLSQQKQTTAQLLDETEKALNGLSRTLSHDEEEIVNQIRSYIGQSRTATKDGDFERAYNLATKAHLLSDALVKK